MTRTEEEKLTQSPIVVILGGKEYEIRLLRIAEARAWRKQFSKAWVELQRNVAVQPDNVEDFSKAMAKMLGSTPDITADLFFDYAKELDRDEIEGIATDTELAKAFTQVVEVAYPLLVSLAGAMGKLSR